MSDTSLRSHERAVEQARARLADDLATLRSPATFSAFADDLKHEALDAKDAIMDNTKSAVQSTLNSVLEDIKAKAAANPAAALAIGAGLAWRFIRNPPIATALVGVGLFSLLRTDASAPKNGYQPDYVEEGKQRLKEQAGEVFAKAKEVAGDVQGAVAAKASDLTDAAANKVQDWGDQALDAAREISSAVKARASTAADELRRTQHDVTNYVQETAGHATDRADRLVRETVAVGQRALSDTDSRDKLLLGVAGLAVAAALGMACQKRLTETAEKS
jgi:gas vesicle protein